MEDRAEPPTWLPEGAAPAVAEDEAPGEAAVDDTSADLDPITFDAGGQQDGAGEGEAEDGGAFEPAAEAEDEPAGRVFEPAAVVEDEPAARSVWERASGPAYENSASSYPRAAAAPGYEHGEATAYGAGGGYGGYAGSYYPGTVREDGYTNSMSPPAGDPPSMPPYPAEYAAQPSSGAPAPAAPAAAVKRTGQARRANLVVARLEPWSVMKFSFLMSLVAWVVLFVAVALLYYALSSLGVFSAIGKALENVTSSQGSAGVSIARWTSASRVLGYTMLLGAVDIVLITLLSTVGAMIYNLVTHLGGGIEVTLRETD